MSEDNPARELCRLYIQGKIKSEEFIRRSKELEPKQPTDETKGITDMFGGNLLDD